MDPTTEPITIRDVLLGNVTGAAGVAAERLRNSGRLRVVDEALPALSGPAKDLVYEHAAACVTDLLDVKVIDVLTDAWRTHRALVAAARATVADPAAIQAVDVAAHRITFASQPSIEILVNQARKATIQCALSLVLDVRKLIGAVHSGRLVSVRKGECDLTASFAVAGKTIALQTTKLDLRRTLYLGAGIPLVAVNGSTPAAGLGR